MPLSFDDANRILKEDYLPAVRFNLEAANRVFLEDYTVRQHKPLTRRQRLRRRVRAIRRRLSETWGVLRHGLPDPW